MESKFTVLDKVIKKPINLRLKLNQLAIQTYNYPELFTTAQYALLSYFIKFFIMKPKLKVYLTRSSNIITKVC